VNATGPVVSVYKLNANFSSANAAISENATNNTTIKIIAAAINIIVSDDAQNITFGQDLDPGSSDNPATKNSLNSYGVTCDYPGATCNISVKGNYNLMSQSNILGIGNISWAKVNDVLFQNAMSLYYQVVNASLPDQATQLLYYWLDIPGAQIAGNYYTNYTIQGEPA